MTTQTTRRLCRGHLAVENSACHPTATRGKDASGPARVPEDVLLAKSIERTVIHPEGTIDLASTETVGFSKSRSLAGFAKWMVTYRLYEDLEGGSL